MSDQLKATATKASNQFRRSKKQRKESVDTWIYSEIDMQTAVAAERERCAQIAEGVWGHDLSLTVLGVCSRIADTIRKQATRIENNDAVIQWERLK